MAHAAGHHLSHESLSDAASLPATSCPAQFFLSPLFPHQQDKSSDSIKPDSEAKELFLALLRSGLLTAQRNMR